MLLCTCKDDTILLKMLWHLESPISATLSLCNIANYTRHTDTMIMRELRFVIKRVFNSGIIKCLSSYILFRSCIIIKNVIISGVSFKSTGLSYKTYYILTSTDPIICTNRGCSMQSKNFFQVIALGNLKGARFMSSTILST